jgi:hypothetical protein
MCWEIDRFKDANVDSRTLGLENQCREAEAGTPARGYQPSIDVTLQPAALESGELMIIWATWCQRSVAGWRRRAVFGAAAWFRRLSASMSSHTPA